MKANVLLVMNCSLAPSPLAIVSYTFAQVYAEKHDIRTKLSVSQMSINGFIVGNSATQMMLNKPEFTHLILTSDDTICNEDMIVRLVNDDKDIVSGIYRMRDPNVNGLAVYGEEGEVYDQWVKDEALIERKFCSAHSMTIKREVLEAMVEKYPELTYHAEDKDIAGIWMPYVENHKIYCDDWAFCQRAKQVGFKCWIDFGVQLKHRCDVWLEV